MRNKSSQGTYPLFHNRSLESDWITVNTDVTLQTLIPVPVPLSGNYYIEHEKNMRF